MAKGTGFVCQLAKLGPDITPISGGGGDWVKARVIQRPLPPLQLQPPPHRSSPVVVAATGSTWVVIMPSFIVGFASSDLYVIRLRPIAPGSK